MKKIRRTIGKLSAAAHNRLTSDGAKALSVWSNSGLVERATQLASRSAKRKLDSTRTPPAPAAALKIGGGDRQPILERRQRNF
jgi:hypothetical protein